MVRLERARAMAVRIANSSRCTVNVAIEFDHDDDEQRADVFGKYWDPTTCKSHCKGACAAVNWAVRYRTEKAAIKPSALIG